MTDPTTPPQIVTDGLHPKVAVSTGVATVLGLVAAFLNQASGSEMLGTLPPWAQFVIVFLIPPITVLAGGAAAGPGKTKVDPGRVTSPVEHLEARAGATFGPRGWPLLDANGAPLRDPAGIVVRAQVRDRAGPDGPIRHEFRSTAPSPNITLALVTFPDDPIPQVCALLSATKDETAAWTWRRLPYDVLVIAAGRTDEVVHGDFIVRAGITR